MTDDLTRALEVAEELELRAVRTRHITLAGQLATAASLLRRLVERCREAESEEEKGDLSILCGHCGTLVGGEEEGYLVRWVMCRECQAKEASK